MLALHIDQQQILPYLVMVFGECLMNTWPILAKVVLNGGMNPLGFALLRELCASFLLFLICCIQRKLQPIDRKDLPVFLTLGLTAFVVVIGFLFALQQLEPTLTSILFLLIPIFTLLFSVCLRIESLNIMRCVGIITAIIGAIISILCVHQPNPNPNGEQETFHWVGLGLFFLVLVGCSINLLLVQQMVRKYAPVFVFWVYYSIAAVCTCIFAAWKLESFSEVWLKNRVEWGALAYSVCATTVGFYWLQAWVLSKLPASTVASFNTLDPPIMALLSYIVFGHSLTLGQGIGAVVVISGMLIVVHSRAEAGGKQHIEEDNIELEKMLP